MTKRPRIVSRSPPSASSSDGPAIPKARKRFRSSSPYSDDDEGAEGNRPIKVYIVQEKLDEQTIRELFDVVENSQGGLDLELCSDAADADLVITGIRMRKRLERHVSWTIAKQKAIVTPDWLRESAKQGRRAECGNYPALRELHDETVAHCPDEGTADRANSDKSGATLVPDLPERSLDIEARILTTKPTSQRVFNNWKSKYACVRASPLICPNQALVEELGILGRSRELEGLRINALAYERAVARSAYPFVVTRETYARDIVGLPGLGEKILSKIKEFIKDGYIRESQEIRASERFQSLSTFAQIYGIGPSNARMLYDIGLRTIADLERYYDVYPGASVSAVEAQLLDLDDAPIYTPNGRRIPKSAISSKRANNDNLPDVSIKIALALRTDLEVLIPREEVEEMHRVVMKELDVIQPGCVSTIVGGYRRGKLQSNDVDIVISHSDLKSGANIVKGLCTKLTKHLYTCGLVTHLMHLSGFHAHDALRQAHWDSLEKALTVFRLPADAKEVRHYRRLDLIFAAPEAYWTAVVGWSGSRMFQRDLRLWAKVERGMKFDSSGLTRRHNSTLYIPRSEQEVFDLLGLDWIDPTMRNANV